MAMDDRKQKIMMAIVSLYASEGEPVGSNLLSRYFDMSVSSATLRNEMAALTRLGLLEQPHTSAGRVPTPKGYRYYVDNLLDGPDVLSPKQRQEVDALVHGLDHDPQKLASGAAHALSDYLEYAVLATTPLAKDMYIAHFEVIQVGRYSAAVLGVTAAGGVLTRVAKVDFELGNDEAKRLEDTLNSHLCFIVEADITPSRIRVMVDSLGTMGPLSWPVLSAALTLLHEAGKPSIYFEGYKYLLQWPELEGSLRSLLELSGDRDRVEHLLHPGAGNTMVLFGDELPEKPIRDTCIVSRQYLAGGGLYGAIAVVGPTRMRFSRVIPILEYFSDQIERLISGVGPAPLPPR